jgi:hypothetical protein
MSGVRWAIQGNPMFSRFAADVSPTMPTAYPRPQLVRPGDSWQPLDGLWGLTVQHGTHVLPSEAPGALGPDAQQILVPYPLEAALSGVRINPSDWVGGEWGKRINGSSPCLFYYQRRFSTSLLAAETGRLLLRFGACTSAQQ